MIRMYLNTGGDFFHPVTHQLVKSGQIYEIPASMPCENVAGVAVDATAKKPIAEPAQKPIAEPAQKPIAEPAQKTVVDLAQKPKAETSQKPNTEDVEVIVNSADTKKK
jgi:hypothetical protein